MPVTSLFVLFSTFLGKKEKAVNTYSTILRKEMVLVAEEGSKRGALFESVNNVIKNILQLKDITFNNIKVEGVGLFEKSKNKPTKQSKKRIITSHTIADISNEDYLSNHENILIYEKDKSTVCGWISLLDIAKAQKNNKIESIVRPFPEITPKTHLLQFFSKKNRFLLSIF